MMEKFKNKIVRLLILICAMILGLYLVGNTQVLSCDDKINFYMEGDSLYVINNNLDMMPMVRYEFVFHLKNHRPISLIYVPDKFNGKISVKILQAKMKVLRYYSLEKIGVHSPFGTYNTNKISDNQYFIDYLK